LRNAFSFRANLRVRTTGRDQRLPFGAMRGSASTLTRCTTPPGSRDKHFVFCETGAAMG
jgi:hypothetical protein